VEKLKLFYEEVFGWKIIQAVEPIEYWIIETVPVDPDGMLYRPFVNGGMYKKQIPESKHVNYFAVESITDFLTKIEKLGGKVTQPKAEVQEIGWIANAEDPEGNLFALIQPIGFS
jgi:uncharacterized protein